LIFSRFWESLTGARRISEFLISKDGTNRDHYWETLVFPRTIDTIASSGFLARHASPQGPHTMEDNLSLISSSLVALLCSLSPSTAWLSPLPQSPQRRRAHHKNSSDPHTVVPFDGSTSLRLFPEFLQQWGRPFHLRYPCSMSGLNTSPRVARAGRRRHGSPAQQMLAAATNGRPRCYEEPSTLLQTGRWRCYKQPSNLLQRAARAATERRQLCYKQLSATSAGDCCCKFGRR
jgi:hypothetical protein